MKKINNKGFTLVELLGVIVILIIITAIAVPSISSSIERAKAKKNEEVNKALEYAVEFYFSDNKDARTKNNCYIDINGELVEQRYIMKDEVKTTNKYIIYKKNGSDFSIELTNDKGDKEKCVGS